MARELIHIYGPFSIQSFGLAIAIGILTFTWMTLRHPMRKKIISGDAFLDILVIGTLIAFAGGRLLYVVSEWPHISFLESLQVWNGGFSILGGFISTLLLVPLYLKKKGIPVLPFADLVALHIPLLQSIARIGCFFAGCCFGQATTLPWAIIYTDPSGLAPCNISIHPTQLYSSLILFGIFLLLYFGAQRWCTKPGQLASLYLILISIQRFALDFLRADREFFSSTISSTLSTHQVIACSIFIFGMIGLIYSTFFTARSYKQL